MTAAMPTCARRGCSADSTVPWTHSPSYPLCLCHSLLALEHNSVFLHFDFLAGHVGQTQEQSHLASRGGVRLEVGLELGLRLGLHTKIAIVRIGGMGR